MRVREAWGVGARLLHAAANLSFVACTRRRRNATSAPPLDRWKLQHRRGHLTGRVRSQQHLRYYCHWHRHRRLRWGVSVRSVAVDVSALLCVSQRVFSRGKAHPVPKKPLFHKRNPNGCIVGTAVSSHSAYQVQIANYAVVPWQAETRSVRNQHAGQQFIQPIRQQVSGNFLLLFVG